MSTFHTNPFILRFGDLLPVLIRYGAVFALYHIADVDLILAYHLDGFTRPQMIDVPYIRGAFPLIVQCSGRRNVILVQQNRNRAERHAGCPEGKDSADGRSRFFINEKMMLVGRVTHIAVGRIGSHVFAVLSAGFLDCLDLLGGIP